MKEWQCTQTAATPIQDYGNYPLTPFCLAQDCSARCACRHFAAEALLQEETDSEDAAAPPLAHKAPLQRIPDGTAALAERKASHAQASTAQRASARLAVRQTIFDDSEHRIRPRDIPRCVWTVLLRLRGAGWNNHPGLHAQLRPSRETIS